MVNPIMEMLNGRRPSGPFDKLNMVRTIMQGGDPSQIVQAEMQRNPAFAQFVNANKGKTIEQLMSEYGIDSNMLRMFM